MVRHPKIVIIGLICLTLLGLCLNLQSTKAETSSLSVQVRNQLSNEPIPGASVVIDGPSSHSGISNAKGYVFFDNIPSGNYSLVVSLESYPNSSPQMITVNGATSTLVLFSYTKAYFTYTPRHPDISQTVTFNASLSSASAPIEDYVWDFGDETDGTGLYPTHNYDKAGSYTVSLTVHSAVGAAIYTQLVVVGTQNQDIPTAWVVILFPFFLPLILIWRRRHYYIVIQARATPCSKNPHCPGDDTNCDNCKVTPC
jgi:PKD repeat protein